MRRVSRSPSALVNEQYDEPAVPSQRRYVHSSLTVGSRSRIWSRTAAVVREPSVAGWSWTHAETIAFAYTSAVVG
jgi:hypothetical protein